jgi:outer membrane receptor protein involved in Fe transport
LGATGTYLSERYGPSQAFAQQALINPSTSVRESVSYPHLFMANVNVAVNQIAKNLNVSLVASNIFNSKYVLIQPYYAGHAPVPANDRQITLSFTYEFSK